MERQAIHFEGDFRVCIDTTLNVYVAYVKIAGDKFDLNIGRGETPAKAMKDAIDP